MKKGSKGDGYFGDQKLKNFVFDYCDRNKESIQIDVIVGAILNLREYQRKPREPLTKMVTKAVQSWRALNTPTQSRKKRDESDSDDVDSSVQLMEDKVMIRINKFTIKDYNFMNASLLNSYKEKAQTIDLGVAPPTPPQVSISKDLPLPETPVETPKSTLKKKANPDDPTETKKRRLRNKDSVEAMIASRRSPLQPSPIPEHGYEVLGGIDTLLEEIRQLAEWPMIYPQLYSELGVRPPRGILLHGPPGCGKTILANAIAGELAKKLSQVKELVYFRVSGPELVSGMSGESESNIRNLFETAKTNEPCVVFIDEIDAICPRRDTASKEMERRIVSTLLTSFDDITADATSRILIIGATNRIDSIDSSLRRSGRFDRELSLQVPDEKARINILKIHTRPMKLEASFDYLAIARKTPGFVGADLSALCNEAACLAVKRILESIPKPNRDSMDIDNEETQIQEVHQILNTSHLREMFVTLNDFEIASKKIQPSAKREGFATIPNVTWEDVGALHEIRRELALNILEPIKMPEKYAAMGLDQPAGVLLFGPPGCGKTLLAKAIASDCAASFISVKGPELLNKYVGESERSVRKVFERAKHSAPCIIFFDELDALCPRRDDDGNSATKRVVNMLLTELDGLEERKGVFVIGATNRPDMIDPAMLRNQRFGKHLYVPLPDPESRVQILETLARKTRLHPSVSLRDVSGKCVRFSGADLAGLIREASVTALSKHLDSSDVSAIYIQNEDFDDAFKKVHPSVSAEEEKKYLTLQSSLLENRNRG